MLRCKDISKLSSDYIDNNLSTLMKIKVKLHLTMCHHCRNFIHQLRTTVKILNKLTPPPPSDKFVNKQAATLLDIANGLKPPPPDHKD